MCILLFIGETGIGKTTLMSTLFNRELPLKPNNHFEQSVSIQEHQEGGQHVLSSQVANYLHKFLFDKNAYYENVWDRVFLDALNFFSSLFSKI